jgi:hypothetical protein
MHQMEAQPRPASYAIDGAAVLRRVDPASYAISFETAETLEDGHAGQAGGKGQTRRLPMTDPMVLLLEDFLRRMENAQRPQPANPILIQSLALLRDVHAAAVQAEQSGRLGGKWAAAA